MNKSVRGIIAESDSATNHSYIIELLQSEATDKSFKGMRYYMDSIQNKIFLALLLQEGHISCVFTPFSNDAPLRGTR